MKLKHPLILFCALLSGLAQAGGTPEFVALPEGYTSQINYMTQNRVGQEQIAKIYTRENLLQAIASEEPVPEGGTIVMEVYAYHFAPKLRVLLESTDPVICGRAAATTLRSIEFKQGYFAGAAVKAYYRAGGGAGREGKNAATQGEQCRS